MGDLVRVWYGVYASKPAIGWGKANSIELTQPPNHRSNRPKAQGLIVHAAEVPARHMTKRDGIPVTTVARTVVDLARDLGKKVVHFTWQELFGQTALVIARIRRAWASPSAV